MYSIVSVIYGVPLDEELHEHLNNLNLDDIEDIGFTTLYHGGSDWSPGFIGVKLCEFDECQLAMKVSELKLEPTVKQIGDAEEKLQNLIKIHPEFEDLYAKMDIYLVFHTS